VGSSADGYSFHGNLYKTLQSYSPGARILLMMSVFLGFYAFLDYPLPAQRLYSPHELASSLSSSYPMLKMAARLTSKLEFYIILYNGRTVERHYLTSHFLGIRQ